jgi:DMSO/TMAO reductase YedYZ molybdopterin-dependent catalytic subunit
VALAEVLDRCGPKPTARELVFRGADQGRVPGGRLPVPYERSLSLEDARRSGALLAYAMNGEPLPIQHGYPLRLIVPGWYAMASVKWLTEIELIDRAFDGHFQTGAYFVESRQGARAPVRLQNVRGLITEPAPDDQLAPGEHAIRGVAWSGAAPVAKVEVSVNGGRWLPASLIGERSQHGWRWWELIARIDRPGPIALRARATDAAGRVQPERAEWNRLGYGNNAIHELVVRVHGSARLKAHA